MSGGGDKRKRDLQKKWVFFLKKSSAKPIAKTYLNFEGRLCRMVAMPWAKVGRVAAAKKALAAEIKAAKLDGRTIFLHIHFALVIC